MHKKNQIMALLLSAAMLTSASGGFTNGAVIEWEQRFARVVPVRREEVPSWILQTYSKT